MTKIRIGTIKCASCGKKTRDAVIEVWKCPHCDCKYKLDEKHEGKGFALTMLPFSKQSKRYKQFVKDNP